VQDSQILLSNLSETGILRLTLNDPKRRNALSEAMLTALGAAFETAGSNPDVRVIILAANGTAFCAGHDLKELTSGRQSDDRGGLFCQDHGDVFWRHAIDRCLPKARDGGVRTMRTSLRFDLNPRPSQQAAAATQREQRHGSA
jgi:enoyl-CoA hydratase/carnithine racemase